MNLSAQLEQNRVNQNNCNSQFQSVEKTFADYKAWSEGRKALIRDRITIVDRKTKYFSAILGNRDAHGQHLFAQAINVRNSTRQDCVLPD